MATTALNHTGTLSLYNYIIVIKHYIRVIAYMYRALHRYWHYPQPFTKINLLTA